MGASAFIMAETTGVSYGTIALAAVLPALLYYLGVMAQVHFRAGRDNLKGVPKADLPRVKEVLKSADIYYFQLLRLWCSYSSQFRSAMQRFILFY